jgi:hypothetical protein
MATPSPWKNQIVGYGEEPPESLLAHPMNPKIHPKIQQDALAGSLSELGWIAPVIVNRVTAHVLDGHARIGLAISRSEPLVPIAYVELSPEQEALALAIYDPIGAMAVTDREQLDALLREVGTGDAAVQAMLDSLAGLSLDPSAEWQGMPAFEHEDQTAQAAFTIRVFLKDSDDLAAFGRLLGKELTGRKFVWFSKQPHGNLYEVYDEMPT